VAFHMRCLRSSPRTSLSGRNRSVLMKWRDKMRDLRNLLPSQVVQNDWLTQKHFVVAAQKQSFQELLWPSRNCWTPGVREMWSV